MQDEEPRPLVQEKLNSVHKWLSYGHKAFGKEIALTRSLFGVMTSYQQGKRRMVGSTVSASFVGPKQYVPELLSFIDRLIEISIIGSSSNTV